MALIIKSLAVDPPNYDELSDDEDDFVKDPAQYRDQLPQPYRLIDELLNFFLDDVWEKITFQENEKAAELSKIRPPKYDCAVQLSENPLTKAMAATNDGRYLFAAFIGGISMFDAAKKKVLYTYEDDHLDIQQLSCTTINAEMYIISAVDDLGICRLFASVAEKIFVMKVLTEDASTRLCAVKCEVSADGDYMGVVLENPTNNDTVLEVYSLPRDIWIKELEDIKGKLAAAAEAKQQPQSTVITEATNNNADQTPLQTESELTEEAEKRSTESTASKKGMSDYKFTPVAIVMRQHHPEKLQANQGISPAAALKEVSDPKHILGSGQGHVLTRPYIEIRQEAFNDLHIDKRMYKLPENENESNHLDCSFHFFTPGLAIPYGIEQPGTSKKPNSIGIWWSGSSKFTYYSLTKPVKVKKAAGDAPDAELDLKPETVWPQTAVITSSATSPDSTLVALGLKNGIVTIWDKHLCCIRKSVLVCQSAITKLNFLEPSICPQSNNRQRCYPTTTSCYVLIGAADSSLHLLNCGQLDFSPPTNISQKASNDDEVVTSVTVFPSKCPEVIMKVHKNGTMFLQDVTSSKTLCEVALPITHELTTPWQPVMSIAACGQMLYIKGTQKTEEEYVEKSPTSLFVFQLRSFPVLDAYWLKPRPQIDYTVINPIDTRISCLLTQRVKSSVVRQQRLQKRWPLMKQEVFRIAQIKSH